MKDPALCQMLHCRNLKGHRRLICYKHIQRMQKEFNPAGYTYNNLKQNAKRRSKIFTITLAWFKEFVADTGYLESKGRLAHNMSIDRIEDHKGYVPGNLQVISVSANIRKRYVPYFQQQQLDYDNEF